MGVVQIEARYAARDSVLGVIPTERPLCRRESVQVWSVDAVGNPSERDRSAEHGIAVDRFAREIVCFLRGVSRRARGN
jgi:hypothetical protein